MSAPTSAPPAVSGAPAGGRSRAHRIISYVGEMFPPLLLVPLGLASFFTTYLSLQALSGAVPLRVTPRAWAGAASFVLFMLLFRVYDEIKDMESDRRLAAAGDPRYVGRPLVTGRVLPGDLAVLRWIVTGLLIALNLPLGAPLPLAAFALTFLLTWLSFHWYFVPAISRNLLLAFVTHNPLNLILHGYAASVFAADFAIAAFPPPGVWLIIGLWLVVATWELSRKVRLPAQETAYQTYSSMLGWKVASVLPGIVAVIAAVLLVAVARAMTVRWLALAPLALATLMLATRCLLLRVAPTPARTRLQPWAEAFASVAMLDMILAICFGRTH